MDEKIAQFVSLTNADAEIASQFLEIANGDVAVAVASYLGDGPGWEGGDAAGGNRLGGTAGGSGSAGGGSMPAPPPSNPGPPVPKPATQKKRTGIASLADLKKEESEEGQDYFTGGFNSGINVHDPNAPPESGRPGGSRAGPPAGGGNDLVNSLIRKAQRQAPEEEEAAPSRPVFQGSGHRLGDDAAPSAENSTSSTARPTPRILNYRLTLYRNGFTIEEGPFRSYEDPANRQFLEEIERGFIPQELTQNEPVSEVSIKLEDRKDEDFVPKKVAAQPFSGSGNRLGSTTPSEPATASDGSGDAANGTGEAAAEINLDPDQPIATVQIRLGNGTKLVARLNHGHTIEDLRKFIEARHNFNGRPYELSTTFPRIVLSDSSATVKDAKLDGAVVLVTAR